MIIQKAKNHVEGLPAIQTGGNVGTAAWFVSWQLLKCSKVCLIGIDHGWSENDSWDTIQSHGNAFDKIELDEESPLFEKLFPTITNPFFNCNCILDPIFQYYRNAFLEFIERSPEWVTTINATEGGSIFGNRITCIRFEEFLKNL